MKGKIQKMKTVEELKEISRDLAELKEVILPMLSRLCSKFEELVKENTVLQQELDRIHFEQADYDNLNKSYSELTRRYITAKSLISIPDNIADMVKEIIRTRLLVWDKHVLNIDTDPENFDAFIELNEAFKDKPGGKAKIRGKINGKK